VLNCSRVLARLSAYMDGEMTGAESLQVREHLSLCADCERELAKLQAVKDALACLRPVEPPFGLEERLSAKVFDGRRTRLFPQTALMATVAAAAGIAAALWVANRPTDPSATPVASRNAPVPQALDDVYLVGADPFGSHASMLPASQDPGR
jgi:anti-sigma factor RsiW